MRVGAEDVVGDPHAGMDIVAATIKRLVAGLCATQAGVSAEALRLTAAHVSEREQFGQKIATFQAVAQRAADAYIDTEAITLTARQAAWLLANGRPADEALHTAKFWAAEARLPRRARRAASARRHRRRHRVSALPLLPDDAPDRAHARRRRGASEAARRPDRGGTDGGVGTPVAPRPHMSPRSLAAVGPRGCPALLATLMIAALFAMLPSPTRAESLPYLVKNINTATAGSYAQEHTAVNGTLFFVAIQPPAGIGLWKTDGTTTTLVKQLSPDLETSENSEPFWLTAIADTLFFRACDDEAGCELWATDGVTTARVSDIRPGPEDSSPKRLTAVGDTLFFQACEPLHGCELWKSDGVSATRVTEIGAGTAGVRLTGLTNVNGTLFFRACDGSSEVCGLWKTDGVTATRIADVSADSESSPPDDFAVVGNTLFFRSCDEAAGCELWKSDGTTATRVADIEPGTNGSSPWGFTNVGGTLFFIAWDFASGVELWKSDGTSATRVADIEPGPQGSEPRRLTDFDGTLFFTACNTASGCELWKSDGVTTTLFADIDPGPGSGDPGAYDRRFARFGDSLFFNACEPSHGCELWRTDGTTTARVSDGAPGVDSFFPWGLTAVDDTLFFTAYGRAKGSELWKTDGTNVDLVADINTVELESMPWWLTDGGGVLYLAANDALHGVELWKSDGTADGTVQIAETVPGSGDSTVCSLTMAGDTIFFIGTSPDTGGTALWKSDVAGTSLVKKVYPSPSCGLFDHALTAVGSTLYFNACETTGPFTQSCKLWKTDGATTTQVADFPSFDMAAGGDSLYFTTCPSLCDLWKTDGTTVTPIDLDGESPGHLTNVGGTLFFGTYDSATGYGLWKVDGASPTRIPGEIGTDPRELTAVGGTLFYAAFMPATGYELWKSDGVTATPVADINPGPESSYPFDYHLTAVGSTVFFAATEPATGTELWKSDGITTTRVADLEPGPESAFYVMDFEAVGGTLFFHACTVADGCELWRSDGVTAEPVGGIPGSDGIDPAGLTNVAGTLFFTANDGVHGRELWALASSCGDGARDFGEECDDGNTAAGDGCDASCREERPVVATPTPTPIATPALVPRCPDTPVVGCRAPRGGSRGLLALREDTRKGNETLQWKWQSGANGSKTEFGDPVTNGGTDYRICVYSTQGLTLDAAIPAGGTCGRARPRACWKRTAKGFEYYDQQRTPDGIERVKLEARDRTGKTNIEVKGKGSLVHDATFPLATPLTVQLRQENGSVCWESVHTGPPNRNGVQRSNQLGNEALTPASGEPRT